MATYAIGDVQGCYDELQVLLERVGFNPLSPILAGALVEQERRMRGIGVDELASFFKAEERGGRELRRKADREQEIVQACHELGQGPFRGCLAVDVALEQRHQDRGRQPVT